MPPCHTYAQVRGLAGHPQETDVVLFTLRAPSSPQSPSRHAPCKCLLTERTTDQWGHPCLRCPGFGRRGPSRQLSAPWKQCTPPQSPLEELSWAGVGSWGPGCITPSAPGWRCCLEPVVRLSGSQGAAEARSWCVQEGGGRPPSPYSQVTDRVEGGHPLPGENQNSRPGRLLPPAAVPGCSPLPAGSMVTFSLPLPRPAEVTAATHSRYCCPRFRWAIR